MDIDLIKKNIMDNGYYIIKGYLNTKDCNNVINQITKTNPTLLDFSKSINDIEKFQSGGDYRSPNFHKYNQTAKKFLNDSMIHNIFTDLYNREIVKKRCQAGVLIYNKNEKNSSGGGWHIDNYDIQLKAMIYLNTVDDNNGPFTYINNTNKFARKLYPDLNHHRFCDTDINNIPNLKIEELVGNAGDCILFRSDNIHKGKVISKGTRYTLTNYYY